MIYLISYLTLALLFLLVFIKLDRGLNLYEKMFVFILWPVAFLAILTVIRDIACYKMNKEIENTRNYK